jgi:sex pheromone cAD1
MKKILLLSVIIFSTLFFIIACGGDGEEAEGTQYEDGKYMATYTYTDSHGWKPFLKMTVEDGEISSVTFDYVNPEGQLKTNDEGYRERMEPVADTYPAEFTKKLEQRLMENQNAPVDTVSGATSSSEWFNNMATRLLERAEEGNAEDLILPMNTTYHAEDEPDERGWIGSIDITFEDGEIGNVEYDEVKKEGRKVIAKKSEDEAYAERYEEANDLTPTEVFNKLEGSLEAEGEPEEVDAISGATGTYNRFVKLAEQALSIRQKATVPE